MFLPQDIRNIKSSDRDVRRFGYLVGGIALGIGIFLFYFGRGSGFWWALFGAALVVLGFASPRALRPVHTAWMAFGIVMGFFVTNVVLTIFFYLLFTPLAFLLRLSGKRFLDLELRGTAKSYWRRRDPGRAPRENIEKQF